MSSTLEGDTERGVDDKEKVNEGRGRTPRETVGWIFFFQSATFPFYYSNCLFRRNILERVLSREVSNRIYISTSPPPSLPSLLYLRNICKRFCSQKYLERNWNCCIEFIVTLDTFFFLLQSRIQIFPSSRNIEQEKRIKNNPSTFPSSLKTGGFSILRFPLSPLQDSSVVVVTSAFRVAREEGGGGRYVREIREELPFTTTVIVPLRSCLS